MREAKVSMRVNILSHSKCLAWRNVCAEQCEQTKRQTLTTMLTLHAMHIMLRAAHHIEKLVQRRVVGLLGRA